MRKALMLLAMFAALAIPTVALAATLDPSKFGEYITEGDKCPNGAYYHIVHPGPDGGDDGTVTVTFDSGTSPVVEDSYQSPGKTTHYLVFGTGKLLTAEDDIPGVKLVISGYECKK